MTDFLMDDIGLSHALAVLIAQTLGVFVVAMFGLLWTLLGIWIERKIAGRMQDRIGPNRVGPFGLVQTIADMVKIIVKEDIVPRGADRWVFNLAPILSVMGVMLLWVVVPFSAGWIGTDLSIGALYLIAAGSLGNIAVLMAGWASNNKFALVGAFRAIAQLISYEVPMVLALLIPVLMAGSLSTQEIVREQHIMYAIAVPLTLLIFLVSSQAEMGRGPFDLLEAESELVAGYQTEYAGMKFGMFYVAEFLHAFTAGVLTAIFFLGGWRGPWAEDVHILGFVYLMIKSMAAYFVLIWLRMTVPRLRIDQLLNFNWKFLVPVSLINLLVVAFVWKLIPDTDTINSLEDALLPTAALLVANGIMIGVIGWALRERGRRERARIASIYAQPAAGD
ncbi:MAG TPA: NADH-quinone oxidoreductase subunit NuoH [Aggregatilineaceae bacterium]|nr:NADH-quinone oxidoreductase subunit NuoH [Aggregatilineaceae bacterium]